MNTIKQNLPLFLAFIFTIIWFKNCDNQSVSEAVKEVTTKDRIIYTIRTDTSYIVEHTNREFELFNLLDSKSDEVVSLKKQLAAQQIKINQLASAIQISSNVRDTIYRDSIFLSDSIITAIDSTSKNLNYIISINPNKRNLMMSYTYRSNYQFYSYYEKQGLFKKRTLKLRIVSDDPNNTISAKTFTIKPKKKITVSSGIGFGVGLGYVNGGVKIVPTIGYNIIIHKK
jgi:predicted Zn-dependent protease